MPRKKRVATRIIEGLKEAVRHAKGEITLRTDEVDYLAVDAYLVEEGDPNTGARDIIIKRMKQENGTVLWAVLDGGEGGACLTKEGAWEFQPMPSNRTKEFLKRARYTTVARAYAALVAWKGPHKTVFEKWADEREKRKKQ